MERWKALVALVGLLFAQPLVASDGSQWFSLLKQNRPLAAVHALRQLAGREQLAAQTAVFVGDEGPACAMFEAMVFPEDATYREAAGVIAPMALTRRVVMLNEWHSRSIHRAFLSQLIDLLHEQGFDALAAETFVASAPARLAEGVVDVDTGFYTADPVFAAALRNAHVRGWEFVAYEPKGAAGKEAREAGQAAALAQWLNANPGRKLLVYAGGSHVSKVSADGWMAARLMESTGIDPLTIVQGSASCGRANEQWPTDAAVPVVAMKDGRALGGEGLADIVVFHPPAAIAAAAETMGPEVGICLAPTHDETLLRAFVVGDPASAIPRFQMIVDAQVGVGTLRLHPGRYRIEREALDGRQVLGNVEVGPHPVADCIAIEAN